MSEYSIFSDQINTMRDSDLEKLNNLLPWMCFTEDIRGRKFGNIAWEGKRSKPEIIPDERIIKLNALFNLSNKSVLEFGCFEGIHTIGLAHFSAEVYAIDSRVENVLKTLVRSNLFGVKPSVGVSDLENNEDFNRLPIADIVHHVGVFYHLKDPVEHLFKLKTLARNGILLDTHYATQEMAQEKLIHKGKTYQYYTHKEGGVKDVFSGMYDHAKWLLLEDIVSILQSTGFSDILIYRDEIERNGPRVTLYASKPGAKE